MMKNKKIIASFELTLMIVSMFAFAHGVYLTEGSFEKLKEKYIAEKNQSPIDAQQSQSNLLSIAGFILNKIKEPIIPVVSAQETGCCSLVDTGEKCVTTTRNICSGQFAEGSICDTTSFCRKGCCFDENTGIYDSNVLESECPVSWVNDPNCNLPGARLGCCILGDTSFFETEGQCEVRTLSFAQGSNPIVDWRGDMSGTQCLMLSATQNEGACVSQSGDCVFETEAQCYSHNGNFNENFLCTSPSLDTNCERTSQTTCVDGKDGVYFIDSCGNRANIYDLDRVNDSTYWDTLLSPEEICGDNDMTASVNSEACGNCNRFMGSTCDSASENNFNVRLGDFYCKDTSCMLGGVKYKNGESWCAYDGKIGDGDDVVGSRHWKYVCSQGEINIEPCADYRNQICVQSNTDSSSGTTEFRNAACVANNWRECVTLNSAEGPGECADTLNCMVQTVNIADHFKFDMCVPKYPGGFSLTNERYQKSAEGICGMATQTCTVVYAPNTWGGCHVAANEGCLHPEFYEQMNNLCRKLGDCGAEVNVIGEYERGDNMASRLGSSAILSLINLAKPVPGQFASVEDYSKYLGSTGQWVNPEEAPGSEGSDNITSAASSISTGIGAIGYAAGIYAEFISGNLETLSLKELSSLKDLSTIAESGSAGSSVAAYSGAAMGAAAGFYVGSMLAKQMGLSPGGSMLMAVGGAMLGGQLAYTYMTTGLAMGPVGWIGVALIVISMFFAGAGCPSVDVTFTCKPWKAPSGGDDCKKCNDDPLRPCSEYRCNSLGAACGIVNKGTAQEMCESSRDDGKPPIISPQLGVLSQNEVYSDISESGLSITSVAGGCIDAYTPLVFGVTTDELSYCKFDIEEKEFNDMQFDLGGNAYLYNHTMPFVLPDPSHGQSQGSNWTGDLSLYVKCMDTHGHESPSYYTIDMCINEGPDKTAPIVRATEPTNNGIVAFNATSQNIMIVTNELSTCRWDSSDADYSSMNNSMVCNDTLFHQSNPMGYVCTDTVPVTSTENIYYVKCMDQPWLNDSSERNSNAESFVYMIRKPDKKITIDSIEPNQDFEIATDMTSIELKIRTSGGGEWHYCSYSLSGYDDMIEMFETGAGSLHTQMLNRPAGTHDIYIQCEDETGDMVRGSTEFKIIKDTSAPQISRIWQSNRRLYIITTGNSECRYSTTSCRFNWDGAESTGTAEEHIISAIRGNAYYIRCMDEFGNAPSGCSISTKVL